MTDTIRKLKSILALRGESMSSLAEKIGTSTQNLSQKLKRDMRYSELEQILDVLGYKCEWVEK